MMTERPIKRSLYRQLWWCTHAIPALREAEVAGSQVQAQPGQLSNLMNPCLKIERAGDIALCEGSKKRNEESGLIEKTKWYLLLDSTFSPLT